MLQPAPNDAKSKAYAVNGSNNYNQTIDAQIWGDVPGRLCRQRATADRLNALSSHLCFRRRVVSRFMGSCSHNYPTLAHLIEAKARHSCGGPRFKFRAIWAGAIIVRRKMNRLLFCLWLGLVLPLRVLAWNAEGHMVVAQIAYNHLDPP